MLAKELLNASLTKLGEIFWRGCLSMVLLFINELSHAIWFSVKCINFIFKTNHVALHSLAIFGASLIDVLASLVGADETDGFDGGMVTDEVHSYKNT